MKQIPSIEDPARADQQALVRLVMRPLALHGAGRLDEAPEIRIASPASLPLAESLGLAPVQRLRFPVWLVQDFETGPGEALAAVGRG